MATASGSDNVDRNPVTAELEEVFQIPASTQYDESDPSVEFMGVSGDNRLYLVDSANFTLKVMPLTPPHAVTTISLDLHPVQIAVLPNGNFALTTVSKYLLFVIDNQQKKISTVKHYFGIAVGPEDTLIVSCRQDNDIPGCVDMLLFDGTFVRTVVQEASLGVTVDIIPLCVVGNQMLMRDLVRGAIQRIDIKIGEIVDTIIHFEFFACVEAHQDEQGFLYAFIDRSYAIIRSPQGKWRYILSDDNKRKEDDYITAKHFSKCGMMFVAWTNRTDKRCIIKGYKWV